jgi:hypothetical protein
MSPSTISQSDLPQTGDELTKSGVNHIIQTTAPSIVSSNGTSDVKELDASKLTFTRNPNPKPVPELGSAEEASMAAYVTFHSLRNFSTTLTSIPTLP